MDSKPVNQGKSVRRKKSGKGRKDMDGNNVANKNKNSKETDCKNQVSTHLSQKEVNVQERKSDKAELSKTSKDDKVSVLPNKRHFEDKTQDKNNKVNDIKETKGKKSTNLGDGFKDAIEKRNDEAEAGIHSLSKNMKYARRKKKTNEKIEDSWSKSFMENTASFMVKGEKKEDQINYVKENNKEVLETSTGKANFVNNKTENIKVNETKNELERTFCLLGSEKLPPESGKIVDDNSKQSKSMEDEKKIAENVDEDQKENKDSQNSNIEKGTESKENKELKEDKDANEQSTIKGTDLKENNTQIKFPPYRSRFVSDSDSIKKFIKDQPKSEHLRKPNTEISHQKQESITTSNDMTKENTEQPAVNLSEVIDEEKSVKFFISDDESDSDTAIFVDTANTDSQDQYISDSETAIIRDTKQSESQNIYISNADIKLTGIDDTKSDKESITDSIVKTNETPKKETQIISVNKDVIKNDSCLSIKDKINKTDSSVVIDMVEDDSDIIREIILENVALKKESTSDISSSEFEASTIDKLFDDITSGYKDEDKDMVEFHTMEENNETLMCFPRAGEETKEHKLVEVLKSSSDENQGKTCESESNPERVNFAEPKSSEEKDKSSKTEQSSKSISGFGRSYRNSQRYEGLSNSITQKEFLQKEFSGDEASSTEGKRQNRPGQDNMVCGAVSYNTNDSNNMAQVVDDMSFLGITNKVNAPNINISLEEMEGELEMKTERYIMQKHNENSSDGKADIKSKNPFHPDNTNNRDGNDPIPFATAFETLASIKKSLLEAQEYPFQNKLNELSGYTKMLSDGDNDISEDCKSESTHKTASSNSPRSTSGIGDKIKEMLGISHTDEENYSQKGKTIQQKPVSITHIEKRDNDFSDTSQNNVNPVNLGTDDCMNSSKWNNYIESTDSYTQANNSSLKETDEALGKKESFIKSGKSVLNICDPRKITFSGLNKKIKIDTNPSESDTNKQINQKEGKYIKPLKKYSTRSFSQPALVKIDGHEIISEKDLLSESKAENVSQNNRVKTEKPYLRRTLSQDKYEEALNQLTYPSKQQPTNAAKKISIDTKKLEEPIIDPVTDSDSNLIDVDSSENNPLMTFSTDSPIIDHCNSSEMEAYTKYFKKFTHTSEKFIQSLSDTAFESLECENLKIPESGTINKGLWNQKKFDELNIPKKKEDTQDKTIEDYSSIMIFDDLCPDKWKEQCKEQCKEDTKSDCQSESKIRIENDSEFKREPVTVCQATALENFDVKTDHSNIEKQSQSSVRKQKVSWLLNNDSDEKVIQIVPSSKHSEKERTHNKPKRLHSPPPKLPAAIEISDADFDAAIMSTTTSDFNASGSLNTLLSKLSNADICMDKKHRTLSRFSDHHHSVQQSKTPSFNSTLKVSEHNYSSNEKNSETFKRPELVSTTIADWKVSSPVFSAELSLTPQANKNTKESVQMAKSDMKIPSCECSTKTTEKLSSSMHTFTEKFASIKKKSTSSTISFTDKISAPSQENHLSTSLFSVSEKRPSVTPIQSPTEFKESPDLSTHFTDNFSFSDILEDINFKVDGVRSTKV